MLCENCGLKNATSIYMPPNSNNLKYFCGECYKKINNEYELDNLAYVESKKIEIDSICKNCGTSFKDFESSGFFGCEHCYYIFEEYIKAKFLPMFAEQKYMGKKPNIFYIRQDIKNLEQLVELCLKKGDLNKATKYGKELEKLKEENYDKL